MLYFFVGLGIGAVVGFFISALCAVSKTASLEAENWHLRAKADYWRQVALSECPGQIAEEMGDAGD